MNTSSDDDSPPASAPRDVEREPALTDLTTDQSVPKAKKPKAAKKVDVLPDGTHVINSKTKKKLADGSFVTTIKMESIAAANVDAEHQGAKLIKTETRRTRPDGSTLITTTTERIEALRDSPKALEPSAEGDTTAKTAILPDGTRVIKSETKKSLPDGRLNTISTTVQIFGGSQENAASAAPEKEPTQKKHQDPQLSFGQDPRPQAASVVPQSTQYSAAVGPEIDYSGTGTPMPPEFIASDKASKKVNTKLQAANINQSSVLEIQESIHEPKPPEFAALSANDEKEAFKKQSPKTSQVGAQFVNMSSSSPTSEKEKKMEKKVAASPKTENQPGDKEQGESSFKKRQFSFKSRDEELGELPLLHQTKDQSDRSMDSRGKLLSKFGVSDWSLLSIPDDKSEKDDDAGDYRYSVDNPGFTKDGIAIATAIDDTNEDGVKHLHSAVEYDPDAKPPLYKNRKCQVGTVLALVIISIVVAVSVVYGTKKKKIENSPEVLVFVTQSPTLSPTSPPTTDRDTVIREHIEAHVLQRNATFQNMTTTDPRSLALDWILHKDPMKVEECDGNLSQRYILALVAFSLDSLAWKNCGNYTVPEDNRDEESSANTCFVKDIDDMTDEQHNVWLSSVDECDWYGVTCIEESVHWVELSYNTLIGEIPPELSALPNLQILDLSANCLYGTLPSEIGKMSNLEQLDLSSNAFNGFVPNEIFDASNLRNLNLAFQAYYDWNCTRSDGSVVDMYSVKGDPNGSPNWGLEGKILDTQIGKLQNLAQLLLSNNYFSGSIASEIRNLTQLAILNVENNALWGTIPVEMTELKNLQELWLAMNYVTGDLPETIGNMESLDSLSVWGNGNMTGIIPDSLYNLTKLEFLYLHTNDFSGTISEEIGNLKKLKHLNLAENLFSGTLPSQLGLCEELEWLRIEATNINGSVPEAVCILTERYKLNSDDENEEYFKADCLEDNETLASFFECDCCNTCCDHTTGQCIIDK